MLLGFGMGCKLNEQDKQACRCNCGYTCGRKCGLPIMECMEVHYIKDCEHQWDGLVVEFEGGGSVSCSKCGMLAIDHGIMCGP